MSIHYGKSSETGHTLVFTILLVVVLFTLASGLILTTSTDFKVAGAVTHHGTALYSADAGLRNIVCLQNDTTRSPRYLFDSDSYQDLEGDPTLEDLELIDSVDGHLIGISTCEILGSNPLSDPPPYTARCAALVGGASRTVRAEIAPIRILDYAVFSEADVRIAPNITINGKIYSADRLILNGPPIIFNKDVEYVNGIVNQDYGTYNGPVEQIDPWPSLTSVVELAFFELASKETGHCGDGVGLYIGPDSGARHNDLFYLSSSSYQIDLTLFDFSGPFKDPPEPVSYNGTDLERYESGEPLTDFNGIIFIDKHLYIWGINGGRSVEDFHVVDGDKPLSSYYDYPGPNGTGNNLYSNNRLDPLEDGTGGGVVNGVLDPAGRGRNLTIVTAQYQDVYIAHNCFTGTDHAGNPVAMGIISGDAIKITSDSPRTIFIEAALLAVGEDSGYSWYPLGSSSSHQDNYWAEGPDGTYVFDLDNDGIIEDDNGQGQPEDRDETSILSAWSLINEGNLVTYDTPVSGIWASGGHIRIYQYDQKLEYAELPCYPIIPIYGIRPGTWIEEM